MFVLQRVAQVIFELQIQFERWTLLRLFANNLIELGIWPFVDVRVAAVRRFHRDRLDRQVEVVLVGLDIDVDKLLVSVHI